jgi:hypothetical protein
MNTDKLSKLQQIASGSTFSSQTAYDNVSQINNAKLKEKVNYVKDTVKKMYPNNQEKAFESWVEQTKTIPLTDKNFREWYWEQYLTFNPDKRENTKQNLINRTELELSMLETPTQKEHYLRDKVSSWPNWLTNEFKDSLQGLSTRNADTNLNKAKLVYKDDLGRRLTKLSSKSIDPDVGENAHVDDLMKLEKMNLLDVAEVLNGRFGVVNKDGGFTPAFDLKDRSQVYSNDVFGSPSTDEQLLVDELAPDFISSFVKTNLVNQRNKINLDNQASEGFASSVLESGGFPQDKWKDAFSMFAKPDYQTLIKKGLIGEINAGRAYSDEDIVKKLWLAMNEYKDFLGEDNGPNT